jgi:hypothetical protein
MEGPGQLEDDSHLKYAVPCHTTTNTMSWETFTHKDFKRPSTSPSAKHGGLEDAFDMYALY